MTFDEWVKVGREAGWCSRPICFTHDVGVSEEEEQMLEDGDDPCVWALRVVPDGSSS